MITSAFKSNVRRLVAVLFSTCHRQCLLEIISLEFQKVVGCGLLNVGLLHQVAKRRAQR